MGGMEGEKKTGWSQTLLSATTNPNHCGLLYNFSPNRLITPGCFGGQPRAPLYLSSHIKMDNPPRAATAATVKRNKKVQKRIPSPPSILFLAVSWMLLGCCGTHCVVIFPLPIKYLTIWRTGKNEIYTPGDGEEMHEWPPSSGHKPREDLLVPENRNSRRANNSSSLFFSFFSPLVF